MPGASGGVSTTLSPVPKRSVSESTRVAPRCRSDDRDHRVRGRPATPAHRIAGAQQPFVRNRGATIRSLGGEPVEDAAPERGERVGRRRRRESASARVPTRATITTRRGSSVPTTSGFRSSPRPRRASSPSISLRRVRRHGDRRQAVPDDAGQRRRERRRRRRRRIPLALGRRVVTISASGPASRRAARRRPPCRRA